MIRKNTNNKAKRAVLLVHFGDPQFRGSERCLLNLINGIDSNEFDVVLWSNHKELSELVSSVVTEVILSDFGSPFGFSASVSRGRRLLKLLGLIGQAKKLMKRIQPDMIICNSLAPCQWMFPANIFSAIPLLVYLHSTYLPKSRILSFAYGADYIIGVSNFTIENFLSDGFPKKQISVVYSGVDDLANEKRVAALPLRKELNIADDEFVFITLSALVKVKNIDIIIDGFKIASSSGKRMALVIVGDGPCLQELQHSAHGYRVFFCGWRNDLTNILHDSDCFVSATEREALGLSVLEASSMTLPLIGARAGGVMEVITDGETGLLANKGVPASFAECMLKLRDNPEMCKNYGRNARNSFEHRFQIQRMQCEINALIDKLLNSEPRQIGDKIFRFFRISFVVATRRFFPSFFSSQEIPKKNLLLK